MTVTTALIASDTKLAIDLDGEAITYHQNGQDYAINAIPLTESLQAKPSTAGWSLTGRVVIAIAKADIATVKRNDDTVTVPSAWYRLNDGLTVEARVAAIIDDATDPGAWHLDIVRKTA